MTALIVVLTSLVSASGWGAAAYLWVLRRQERAREALYVVEPIPIGSEAGNDDVTRVGEVPTRQGIVNRSVHYLTTTLLPK